MTTAQSFDSVFRDFTHLTVNNSELLGAPLTTGAAMDKALKSRCDDLERAAGRRRLLTGRNALILLRSSFTVLGWSFVLLFCEFLSLSVYLFLITGDYNTLEHTALHMKLIIM